jgi:general secretion pathway protein D
MKRSPSLIALILSALLLAACANDLALREGERLIAEGQPEAGLKQLEDAMRAHPGDLKYRAAYVRQKELHLARQLAKADAELKAGRLDEAQRLYQDVLRLHPESNRAPSGLASIEIEKRNKTLLADAEAAMKRNDHEAARGKLRAILAQNPQHAQAEALLKEANEKAGKPSGVEPVQLIATYRRPITLEFREAPLRSVFDAISKKSGLNFVFDKDVRTDQKATIYARNTAIGDAVDMLLATSQLAKKVLNGNTLLIYPNQPAKLKEYQELVVKGFFLANADPKQVLNLLKTIAKMRDVHVDEKLNMVMVRDTPETVRLAEKLVAMSDRPEPEVMLEVEILEVSRSKLKELGAQWPNQFSVLNIAPSATSVTTATATTVTTPSNTPLTISSLRGLSGRDIAVSPVPSVNLRADDSDVNLLANPRIRVKNREKAKIHIGDKVPVITANVTSTGVTSESVNYLDVGLKLDVEPQVLLQGEVSMKVGLEVSNIVQQVKTATGTLTYQLGSRNANTSLRLKDGETQVLAGLISDQERNNANKVPGLGDIPILGRLFSSHRDEASKTEIVLLITPRILRNVERPELADVEFFAGTDSVTSDQPLRLRPATVPAVPEPQEVAQPAVDETPPPAAPSPVPPPAAPAPVPPPPAPGLPPHLQRQLPAAP